MADALKGLPHGNAKLAILRLIRSALTGQESMQQMSAKLNELAETGVVSTTSTSSDSGNAPKKTPAPRKLPKEIEPKQEAASPQHERKAWTPPSLAF